MQEPWESLGQPNYLLFTGRRTLPLVGGVNAQALVPFQASLPREPR